MSACCPSPNHCLAGGCPVIAVSYTPQLKLVPLIRSMFSLARDAQENSSHLVDTPLLFSRSFAALEQ